MTPHPNYVGTGDCPQSETGTITTINAGMGAEALRNAYFYAAIPYPGDGDGSQNHPVVTDTPKRPTRKPKLEPLAEPTQAKRKRFRSLRK
jgi:hypothetical protein